MAADESATDSLRRAAAPGGVTMETVEERLESPGCPGVAIPMKVTYPRGIDDGGPADGAVESRVAAMIEQSKADYAGLEAGPDGCEAFSGAGIDLYAAVYRLSSGAHSVLLYLDALAEGSRSVLGYVSINLSADGEELTAEDLFPDPAKSLPLLWEAIWQGTCTEELGTGPGYYGSPACPAGAAPALPDSLAPEATLDDMGHAVLTSLGLVISLGPDDGLPEDVESIRLDISKASLLEMGADPELWN
jgi:hypothetical protein